LLRAEGVAVIKMRRGWRRQHTSKDSQRMMFKSEDCLDQKFKKEKYPTFKINIILSFYPLEYQ